MARILVDMDECLVSLLPTWLQTYEARSPSRHNLRREDVTDYHIQKLVPPSEADILMGVIAEPGFFEHLPPIHGAISAISNLACDGHDIRFVTIAYTPEAARGKCVWIEREFAHLGFGMREMILTHDKDQIRGDVIIDDKPAVLDKACSDPSIRTIGFEQPYNTELGFQDRVDFWASPGWQDPWWAWSRILSWIRENVS